MIKILLLSTLALSAMAVFTGCQSVGEFKTPADRWDLGPERVGGGLVGPRHLRPENAAKLGRDKDANKDGDPASYVEKKMKCGTHEDRWCTLTLGISYFGADNERLRITSTGADGRHIERYLKEPTTYDPGTTNSREVTVSVRGCKEHTVRVEIVESARSKKANSQSWAEVSVSAFGVKCEATDRTNKEGRLANREGEPLPRPE